MSNILNDMSPSDKMGFFLELQPDEASSHVTVVDVTSTDISKYNSVHSQGPLPLIRIDKKPPEKFIPNMPKSAMSSENNSIARITCAPSLLGCIIGYFRAEEDLLRSGRPGYGPVPDFKGGYVISKLTPSLVLRPDSELVPDQPRSDEHWIVAFDEEHVEFAPVEIGKCFISDITHFNRGQKPAMIGLTLWVEVTGDTVILAKDAFLSEGCWKIRISWDSIFGRDLRKSASEILSVTKVDMAEYATAKGASAALLSHESPARLKW